MKKKRTTKESQNFLCSLGPYLAVFGGGGTCNCRAGIIIFEKAYKGEMNDIFFLSDFYPIAMFKCTKICPHSFSTKSNQGPPLPPMKFWYPLNPFFGKFINICITL